MINEIEYKKIRLLRRLIKGPHIEKLSDDYIEAYRWLQSFDIDTPKKIEILEHLRLVPPSPNHQSEIHD